MIYYEKDNFLSPEEFKKWQTLHGPKDIPWRYMDRTAIHDENFNDESNWQFSFGCQLMWNGKENHPAGLSAKNLLQKICDDAGIRLGGIFRIRIGLLTKTPTPVLHEPHIDLDLPHLTCLFYCSTTNGSTVLYDKLYQQEKNEEMWLDSSLPKENRRIDCVENKYVIFDGYQYHSVISQTDKRQRIVINFNFENTLRNF